MTLGDGFLRLRSGELLVDWACGRKRRSRRTRYAGRAGGDPNAPADGPVAVLVGELSGGAGRAEHTNLESFVAGLLRPAQVEPPGVVLAERARHRRDAVCEMQHSVPVERREVIVPERGALVRTATVRGEQIR